MSRIRLAYSLAIISLVSLFLAFYLQIEIGLVPCKLCVWQRWPHVINILIIAIFLTLPKKQNILILAGLINMILGTLLAGYHFGLEEGYWNNVFSCSGPQDIEGLSSKQLLSMLKSTPISSCENAQWSIFGFSLAGLNFMISCILLLMWTIKFYLHFLIYDSNSESQ